MKEKRKIKVFGRNFLDFYESIGEGAQQKIDYVLTMLRQQERLSVKFVKHIRDGVYEIRAEYSGNIYRVFFIFDDGNIVVLFNGFQKKSQKTPEKEIRQAIKLKEEYYEQKSRTL